MSKKRVSTTTIIILIVVISVISFAAVAWHDGKFGVTPIGSINDLTVDSGSLVTVRGVITSIAGPLVTITDDTGGVAFSWSDAASLTLYSMVVVKGEVLSPYVLTEITSVERVWLFP